MEAIYDDQFQVDGDRYRIQISPAEALQEPARSEDCILFIFLRPGYPVAEAPLCWFTNGSMPPTLLRQINEFCCQTALDSIGAPTVFEIVSALTDSLPELQMKFIRAQRKKEFDAEQARLRKQQDSGVDQVIDAQYEGVKIGRRQRAKLKAAEKAYDRSDQEHQQEIERRQRQEERIQRAQRADTT